MAKSEPTLIGGVWWLADKKGQWRWWNGERWEAGERPPGMPPLPPPMGRRLRVPSWLAASVVTLALAGGFVAVEHEWLHWYTRPASASTDTAAEAKPAAEPDRVVGSLRECSIPRAAGVISVTGPSCAGTPDDHLHLTIRRASGSTYEVDVPGDYRAFIGDNWP